MDLKDYRVQPDEGLFEKISQRVRRRRLMRRAGAGSAVAVVVIVACVLLWPSGEKSEPVADMRVAVQQPTETPIALEATEIREEIQPTNPSTVTIPREKEVSDVASTAIKENVMAAQPVVAQNDVEPEADFSSLIPQYTHVVADLQKPTIEKKVNSISVNIGSNVEIVTPDTVITKSPIAVKSSEPPVHEDNLFWVPNIIVPSGDVDDNRTFSVRFTSSVSYFHIYIYNRAGHQVYQSSDPSFVWDGTSKGTTLPQGAYVWVMKFRDGDGKLHEARGSVTIIR